MDTVIMPKELTEENGAKAILSGEFFETVTMTEYDFEMDATDQTTCGKLGRKHRMKRISAMKTKCIYPDCDGLC